MDYSNEIERALDQVREEHPDAHELKPVLRHGEVLVEVWSDPHHATTVRPA